MPTEETLALEKAPKDAFLELVEKVIENKEVDAEKLKVLVDLQIQLEDRRAKKQYDAAIIAVRPQIKAVAWDKIGVHNSRYASYPKIDAMLTPLLDEHGLGITFDTEPDPRPNIMMGCCDVMHVGGHTKRYRLPMPIDGSGPKDGGVMTGQQAVKSGVSYMIRTFVGMIFAIPMLVDKDDRDGNAVVASIDDAQKSNLEKMLKGFSEPRQKKFLEKFKIDSLDQLPKSRYNAAIDAINRAREQSGEATVTKEQEANLQALIDEIGGNCKSEFLKANKIAKLSELPANQYQASLKALTDERRAM